MLDFLAPLDYPRQSLYNLGRGLGRIGSGQASLQDLAGMAPGAAGALTSAMFGLPAGVMVGGGLQGLGKLLSPETFEAPGAESLVEALGGDPESWGQTMAAHLASDPMMWMGAGQGTRLGMGLASDLRRPPVGAMSKLIDAPNPVSGIGPAAPGPGLRPKPAYVPEADIVGTPAYLDAAHARNEAQAIQQAAAEAEAAQAQPMNPLMARLEAGRGQPPPRGPNPWEPGYAEALAKYNPADDPLSLVEPREIPVVPEIRPFLTTLAKDTDDLYSMYADLLQDVPQGGPLAGGPSVLQRAQIARDIIKNEKVLGANGFGSMDEVKFKLLARARDDMEMIGSLAGRPWMGGGEPNLLRGVGDDDAQLLKTMANASRGSLGDPTQHFLPLLGQAMNARSPVAQMAKEVDQLRQANLPIPRLPGLFQEMGTAGLPIDRAAVAGHYIEGVPYPAIEYLTTASAQPGAPVSLFQQEQAQGWLRKMLGQQGADDALRAAREQTLSGVGSDLEAHMQLRHRLGPIADRAAVDALAEHGLGSRPELGGQLMDSYKPYFKQQIEDTLENMIGLKNPQGALLQPGYTGMIGAYAPEESGALFAELQKLAMPRRTGAPLTSLGRDLAMKDVPPEALDALLQQMMQAYRAKLGL